MTGPTKTDRLIVVCFWVSLALTIGAALNWARTGHLPAGIFFTGAFTVASSLRYLWTRIS